MTPGLAEIVSAIANTVTALAAISAAIAAWIGLNTWKKQTKWQHDYELAIELYGRFRERREIYNYFRSPHSVLPEIQNAERKKQIDNVRANGKRTEALILYWQVLKETENKQARLFDEAELRWGVDLRQLSEPIIELEHELICSLDDLREVEIGSFRPTEEVKKELDKVLKSRRDSENRKERYNSCFRQLEAVLKPKIVQVG